MSNRGRAEFGVWCNDEDALLHRRNSGRSAEASGRAGQQTGDSQSWDSFPPNSAAQESLAVSNGLDVLEWGQSEPRAARGKSSEAAPVSDVLLLSNNGPVLPAAIPATSSPSPPQGATMHLRLSQQVESTAANRQVAKEGDMQPSLSRPQPRPKSALAKRSTAVSLRPLRIVQESSGRLPAKLQPSNKSAFQHNKVNYKAEKVKDKGKSGAGTMRRAISLSELQPQASAPKTSSAASMSNQRLMPVSKRLLRRLTGSSSPIPNKAPAELPVLAPMEKKILASVGERDWIKVDAQGKASVFRRDKHAMTHELGIQIRDLRLLDPLMASSFPSCILCREKALVVNLEYIKCIITVSYVLVLDAKQPAVKAFVQQLQQRVKEGFALDLSNGAVKRGPTVLSLDRPSMGGSPFELKALEAALDEVCKHLEVLGAELEVSMRPMLGTPTASKVTSDYLERLRRLKSKLARLKTRVETLKEALDRYLGDEADMKAIHLSSRLREQRMAAHRRLARRSLREAFQQSSSAAPAAHEAPSNLQGSYILQQEVDEEGEKDVAEVEMLLEAYYMNLDSTWNKLTDISESVDDTEELLDLEMDTYRNNIIRLKVFLGACHLLAGTIWAISNIFGMNLGLLEDDLYGATHDKFVEVSVISSGSTLVLMLLFTSYLHYHRLAVTTITD